MLTEADTRRRPATRLHPLEDVDASSSVSVAERFFIGIAGRIRASAAAETQDPLGSNYSTRLDSRSRLAVLRTASGNAGTSTAGSFNRSFGRILTLTRA